jgi:hypothetical protein
MSVWDKIDRQFQPKLIERIQPEAGDPCANPRCNGRLEWKAHHRCSCSVLRPCQYCLVTVHTCNACGEPAR